MGAVSEHIVSFQPVWHSTIWSVSWKSIEKFKFHKIWQE